MYTVLWQDSGADRWDRLETKEELAALLAALVDNPGVYEYDVWIFGHEADDYANDYETLLEEDSELKKLVEESGIIESVTDIDVKLEPGMTGRLVADETIKPRLRGKRFEITEVANGLARGTIEGEKGIFCIAPWTIDPQSVQ